MMILVGMFLGGPYNLVAAACSMDLAKQPCLLGKPKALSTVAALLEASAVTVSAFFQILLSYNPGQAFLLFCVLSLLTCMVMYPLALGDWYAIKTLKWMQNKRDLNDQKADPNIYE